MTLEVSVGVTSKEKRCSLGGVPPAKHISAELWQDSHREIYTYHA